MCFKGFGQITASAINLKGLHMTNLAKQIVLASFFVAAGAQAQVPEVKFNCLCAGSPLQSGCYGPAMSFGTKYTQVSETMVNIMFSNNTTLLARLKSEGAAFSRSSGWVCTLPN